MATTMTSTKTYPMDHKPKGPTKARKRAPKARRPQPNASDNVVISQSPYAPAEPHGCGSHSAEAVVKSRLSGLPELSTQLSQEDYGLEQDQTESINNYGSQYGDRRDSIMTEPIDPKAPSLQQPNKQVRASHNTNQTSHPTSLSWYPNNTNNLWSTEPQIRLTSDVVYFYYPFLTMGNLPNIPPQDVNFLELQGCLRVPTRTMLDEFLQQYFLHVHPLLPLINEGDFWDLYCNSANTHMPTERMPLLLFQAILFASCNFVSRDTIKALGFPNIRVARAAFYRRAKLLHDFESESSPLAIAQAALLLSFWAPSSTRNPNTSWLSLAIQHAKSAEAHHYAAMPVFSAATHPMQHRKQNILKKIWWCCVIRDRTLGLLMRRPIQITKAHFDFDSNPVLGFSDIESEFERSRVYNPGTKKTLAEILAQVVELYVVLTDILILVFPLDDTPGWGRQLKPGDEGKIKECKTSLRRWYRSATSRFPLFGGSPLSRGGADNGGEYQHDSVILYTNLIYMYYHSSRVVLSHHEILHLAILQAIPNGDSPNVVTSTRGLSTIYENRHELQDAASGVTECLKELVHLKLARWLPISAVACTALPLVLNILDVKLSASSKDPSLDLNAASALKQHRLNILVEAMKTYQPQYDGVDWVSEIVRHVVNLAQLDNTNAKGNQNSNITDWTDILALQPSSYLRLALALDVSLSKGRLPEDGDFPVSLRGLFVGGFSPLKALIEANRTTNASIEPKLGPGAPTSRGAGAVQSIHSDSDSLHSPLSQTDSNMSNTEEAAIGALRDQIRPRMATDGPVNTNVPPSAGIDGLGVDTHGVFQMNNESPSGTSEFEGMYLDGPMPDVSAEWIETLWDEMGNTDDEADRDIARMLLGALKEGDVGEVTAQF
ncbi:hypothetical protein QQZ08_009859 [Neonectria magnoliae]|uniref:Xylanolytic transcriptional activator regulatory domain-containing protein n=1 Tax=Neonectria magnoliae TaxID=2732573 RepID=A0ABR1HLC7_9HYPO